MPARHGGRRPPASALDRRVLRPALRRTRRALHGRRTQTLLWVRDGTSTARAGAASVTQPGRGQLEPTPRSSQSSRSAAACAHRCPAPGPLATADRAIRASARNPADARPPQPGEPSRPLVPHFARRRRPTAGRHPDRRSALLRTGPGQGNQQAVRIHHPEDRRAGRRGGCHDLS